MNMLQDQVKPAFNAAEYQILFDLTPDNLTQKIIDFPAGLNSFTAENKNVVACDEIYDASLKREKRAKAILEDVQLSNRNQILEKFNADFEKGLTENRYVQGMLPKLPFKDHQFDLMLCSFSFFEKKAHLEDYWRMLIEMLRVATEIRIYPILNDKNSSEVLGPLMLKLQANGFGVEIRSVKFPNLPHSAMLRVWSQNCQLT